MFEQVFENLQKATETSVKLQQEMFQKWMEGFTPASPFPTGIDAASQWRHKWEAASAEMLRKQKELVDRNYEAGIRALEDMFRVADAKSPQDFQQKVTDLYRKSFDSLRQLSESQLAEFKNSVDKWSELMTPTH